MSEKIEHRSNRQQYETMLRMGMLTDQEGRAAVFCRGRLICIESDIMTATVIAQMLLAQFEGNSKANRHEYFDGYTIQNDLSRKLNDD